MSASTAKALDIAIMGRTYKVSCQEEERESLLEAVAYLDRKMGEIKSGGRVGNAERIAVMAALNIAHELLEERARRRRSCCSSPFPARDCENGRAPSGRSRYRSMSPAVCVTAKRSLEPMRTPGRGPMCRRCARPLVGRT